MASQTMLAGMKFSITGTPNSHRFVRLRSNTLASHAMLVNSFAPTIEFFLPVTIVIIPDVLMKNLITKLY